MGVVYCDGRVEDVVVGANEANALGQRDGCSVLEIELGLNDSPNFVGVTVDIKVGEVVGACVTEIYVTDKLL
jgi:hypothetical protein